MPCSLLKRCLTCHNQRRFQDLHNPISFQFRAKMSLHSCYVNFCTILARDSQIEKEDHSRTPLSLQCEYEWDPPGHQLLLLIKLSDPSSHMLPKERPVRTDPQKIKKVRKVLRRMIDKIHLSLSEITLDCLYHKYRMETEITLQKYLEKSSEQTRKLGS